MDKITAYAIIVTISVPAVIIFIATLLVDMSRREFGYDRPKKRKKKI